MTTVRYFSTSSAGAADGTTWDNRAVLFTGGAWSTIITGFDFASDSMVAYIGPGTYSITAALSNALFTVSAPNVSSPLIMHGCDSSGVALTPPDPDWTSDLPNWDTSGLPVLATTTNIYTVLQTWIDCKLLSFTASGITSSNTAPIGAIFGVSWCYVEITSADTDVCGIYGADRITCCIVNMNSATYRCGIAMSSTIQAIHNTKIYGSAGTSGNRHGIEFIGSGTGPSIHQVAISGVGGDGIGTSTSTVSHYYVIRDSVIANIGGTGIKLPSTASQTDAYWIEGCMVTGCGAYGIDAQSARCHLSRVRLRDNTSGNLNSFGNWPTNICVYTTDSDDASEYIDASNRNFRIKSSATIANEGYGISQESRFLILSRNLQGGMQS